jgi:hypothetical protein
MPVVASSVVVCSVLCLGKEGFMSSWPLRAGKSVFFLQKRAGKSLLVAEHILSAE